MNRTSTSADARVGNLSKDRTKLLRLLLQQSDKHAEQVEPTIRRAADGSASAPMSWAQQRLWFIDQLEGGSAGYYVAIAARLRGPVDRRALERAFDGLVKRHESLRTVFVALNGEPKQQLLPPDEFKLAFTDLRGLDATSQQAQVRHHKTEEAHRRFDLQTGPLIRARLLQLSDEEHVLLVTMHHIVSDGWSVGVFVRELGVLYKDYRDGRTTSLVPLPLQYAER